MLPEPISIEMLLGEMGDYVDVQNLTAKEVLSVSSPEEAAAGGLVFTSKVLESDISEILGQTLASVIVAKKSVPIGQQQTLIIVDDPLAWFIQALNVLLPASQPNSINPYSSIAASARIGANVEVGVGTVIDEGCEIGDGCRIGHNCFFGPNTVLGKSGFVQSNVSIGGVGLGYHNAKDGSRLFFPHLGAAILGDDVVVGSGSVIVRGQLNDTVLGDRVRLGNLVNIGHNVVMGADCVISSSTCIAGGTHIGARANIASGVSITSKRKIGENCQIGLGSVVVKDVSDGISVFGNPAAPLRTMRRF